MASCIELPHITLLDVKISPELTTKIRPKTLNLSPQRQPSDHNVRIEEAVPTRPLASWYVESIVDFFFKITLLGVK